MGMLDRFRRKSAGPQVPTNGLEVSRWHAPPQRRGTYELLVAFREMPWFRALVEKISDNVAGVPWRAYRRTRGGVAVRDFSLRGGSLAWRQERYRDLRDAGELQEVPDHPVLALLAAPNDVFTGRAVAKLTQTHIDIVGESFWLLQRAGVTPVGLWPMPPSWVLNLPDYSAPMSERYYRVRVGKVYANIPASEVIHLRNLDPDDPMSRGVGPGFAMGDELDTEEYVARFIRNVFYNDMRPGAVISIEGAPFTPTPEMKAFKESLIQEHRGPENAGKVLLTGGKVTIARMDTSFKDGDVVKLREYLTDLIRMIYGIPPEIMGDVTNSNRATANASQAILAEQVIVPRMEFLRTELQMRLVPLLGDDIILDYDSPVPADRDAQLQLMTALPQGFRWSEIRAAAGLRPDAALPGFPAAMPGAKSDGSGGEKKPGGTGKKPDPATEPDGDEPN